MDCSSWLDVNGFEKDLEEFVNNRKGAEPLNKQVVELSARVCGCAMGEAAGVIHVASTAKTDCQSNDNVETFRVCLGKANIEVRPFGSLCTSSLSIKTLRLTSTAHQ